MHTTAVLIAVMLLIAPAVAAAPRAVRDSFVEAGCFTSCTGAADCGPSSPTCPTCFMGQCVAESFANEAAAAMDATRDGTATERQSDLIGTLPAQMQAQAEAAAKRVMQGLRGRRAGVERALNDDRGL